MIRTANVPRERNASWYDERIPGQDIAKQVSQCVRGKPNITVPANKEHTR